MEPMIKVSVLYPNQQGSKFDLDYYLQKHMPMVERNLGSALRGVTVERGVSGGLPGSRPPYAVICHLAFDSVDAFFAAFEAHAEEVMGDIPNYTNIEPIVQISEVKLTR